jgi:citrate synthase
MTATPEIADGLEGVVAFATEIAEPDKEGGALRYRGVDVEDLVGRVPFEQVWGLLVDGAPRPGLPPAEPVALARRTGDARADLQAALAQLAPEWGLRPLIDLDPDQARDDLARVSAAALSLVAQAAGGDARPATGDGATAAERFLLEWRGEADPVHARALDAYWITAAEHGMNASTFTARVIASTGSDFVSAITGAVGALKGPLHGGAPGPALDMVFEIETLSRAEEVLRRKIESGERLMGFGHRVYKVRDPRADVLAAAAETMLGRGNALYDLARGVESVALRLLEEYKPGRRLQTNVEFYTALVLHGVGLEVPLFTPTFAISRVAGWIAHCFEQRRANRLIRPQSVYVGPRGLSWRAAQPAS